MEQITEIVKNQFGKDILSAEQIHSGNSQVFRLTCGDEEKLIAKSYPNSVDDPRDRLGAEYGGLSFLWQHGIRSIPQPLFADVDQRIGIYECIEGDPVPASSVTSEDITSASSFLGDLASLVQFDDSQNLPNASEACFSYLDYLESVQRRMDLYRGMPEESLLHKSAGTFLQNELHPLFDSTRMWILQTLSDLGSSLSKKLESGNRTFSPSDFGFHNAIRRPNGSLIFVDFEYFGWDDPAKMIADFIHHPAMPLSSSLNKQFHDQMLRVFRNDDTLKLRVRLVYPVLGIKWCLIMLNEFLPGPLERRRKANGSVALEEVLHTQLAKAREKLTEVRTLFEIPTNHTELEMA
jgi:thiamine kinase-like enzyme